MTTEYSVEVCKTLQDKFCCEHLHRPMRISRYEPGTELTYNVTGISSAVSCQIKLKIEKFVGGGFAGQVYQVSLLDIEGDGPIDGLRIGGIYAIKILVPPSNFSRLFRNLLYWVGFQGPFQLQVNPAAARSGALWQKFIRRAAKIRFGDENTIVDIYATFVDSNLGSCGELREWIEGRTWQLEVDDHMDMLNRWRKEKEATTEHLGSPEYRTKRQFMAAFVKLLHEVGAHEFARQYEWWTCKSQPNCLKRKDTDNDSTAGLVAVDFRAGLALLAFLPMSPGDFKLIIDGLRRGSLVQFDRGDLNKLRAFVQANCEQFSDMTAMLEELKTTEQTYRDSIPDITHNHFRLLYDKKLWSTIFTSAITGWRVREVINDKWEQKLRNSGILTFLFFVIGLVPLLGKIVRRIWGRPDWRKHYFSILTSWKYLKAAVRARIAEKVILWHRAGRIDGTGALKKAGSVPRFLCHLPFSILPASLHRFLTDRVYAKRQFIYYTIRPIRLYFNRALREQWLHEMVAEGQKKHMLSDEDAGTILSQLNEPFIQKYLKSLAVHICTLPVTQIVSVLIAVIYVLTHPEMSRAQAWTVGLGIIALFQVVPISPGSLVRGLYVLYLVIKERNFKDYNIAVFLGFFKYIGYLAFPIQMAYHYPAMARFMAGHWATEAVHIVPVFGERGALLEHWVFCLFYNWPLTIRRKMQSRARLRATMQPRYWHVVLYGVVAGAIFGIADYVYAAKCGNLPTLRDIWLISILLPLLCGAMVTLGAGGAKLWTRIAATVVCGIVAAVLYTAISAGLAGNSEPAVGEIVARTVWQGFVFVIFGCIGAIITELKLPDPDLR